MMLISLLQPTVVKLVYLGCFSNKTPLDLQDHVLAYWARKLKDCETRYSAYDIGTTLVDDVSRLWRWRLYLLGCKRFSVVTNHATPTHLLEQPSYKLIDRQNHWVERLIPFAQCMSILYLKGSVNKADAMSRRPEFFPSIRCPHAQANWYVCSLVRW